MNESIQTESRELWTPDAVKLWVELYDPRRRALWLIGTFAPVVLLGPPTVATLVDITRWGNIGFIWLIAATMLVGFLAITLGLAIWLEPSDVRVQLSMTHLGMDDTQVPLREVETVEWQEPHLLVRTTTGEEFRSRPIRPRDPDRLLRLVRGGLPDAEVVPLLRRPDRPPGMQVPSL